jgi:hypothetical protein
VKSLRIVKAKPNPAGKDRNGSFAPPAQLAGEWIDFVNDGNESFPLEAVSLWHVAYQPGCRDAKWDRVTTFSSSVPVGKVVRVHSGDPIPLEQMYPEDARGADYHVFTRRRNYVWNNDCGDTAALQYGQATEDSANYDPYPPEGAVLHRVGDKLMP